jgi:hypothetical protein
MSQKKTVLVATVGTRDLSFQVSEKDWRNVGDVMAKSSDRSTPAQQVYESIATEPGVLGDPGDCFRERTAFLLENWERFGDRIKPVMLGGVVENNVESLEKIYLVATDQVNAAKKFQDSDTCHAAVIIARWVEVHYQIPCEIILLGQGGEKPTDFDAMVRWSKQAVWAVVREAIACQPKKQGIERILLSPKGGVGQCSEALRVTALTGFVEQELQFCDFTENEAENRLGNFSEHQFSSGTHYLWELNQRQAIGLLERYDYMGVKNLLSTQLQVQPHPEANKINKLLDAAEVWNYADFSKFQQLLSDAIAMGVVINAIQRHQDWWWKSYESAYLGVVRLQQGHTVEALLHTFRALEGLVIEWVRATYKEHLRRELGNADEILRSIIDVLPDYNRKFQNLREGRSLLLYGDAGFEMLRVAHPEVCQSASMQRLFGEVKKLRDRSMHQVVKVTEKDIFDAWDVKNKREWESRILDCLNLISGKPYSSLEKASFMPVVHSNLIAAIQAYQP